MAGGGIVSHGSQNKKGGLKALLAAFLALFALSLTGCRNVSQKDSWIVQAVLEAPGETVRLGLLCRSVGPGESEEKWSLFTAGAEDEGKALEEIQQQIRMLKEKYDADIRILNTPDMEIASADIRGRIAGGEDISQMLPAEVEAYIRSHHLYEKG